MPFPPTASVQTSTTEPAQQISVTSENGENLKSPAVNLTALAERVEAAHFPYSTATRPPPPATGESVTMSIVMQLLSKQDHLLLIAFHFGNHFRHHLLIMVSYKIILQIVVMLHSHCSIE